MRVKIGALKTGHKRAKRWDNAIEFTDLDPTPHQWRSLRLLISQHRGMIASLAPIRVVLLDCTKRGAKAWQVIEIVEAVRDLTETWEREEYEDAQR